MRTFDYFTQDGDKYSLKSQKTQAILITAFCMLIGVYLLTIHQVILGLFMIVLGLLVLYRTTAKVVFDVKNNNIHCQKGMFNKETVYSFADFRGFTMRKNKYLNITTNSELRMNFETNGKYKEVTLHRGFRNTKYADKIAEEIEWMMQQNLT